MGVREAARVRGVTRAGEVRIGISGWTYRPWRGVFYPRRLPRKRELEYAARQFRSIEINGTFYRTQTPDTYAAWAARVPDDFVFAVKCPRFITHTRRLTQAEQPLANFIASGLPRLGPKLGPLLWQLPPSFHFDAPRIEAFLDLLPRDTEAAARLGRLHDARLKTSPWLETDQPRPLRHALEIRHDSFRDPVFIDMLRQHDVALVCADTVDWPLLMDVTSDFVYCRLHGSQELYASGYDDNALDTWAARVAAWARGDAPADVPRIGPEPRRQPRDVFVYFDNDAKVRAPVDAKGLAERVSALLSR